MLTILRIFGGILAFFFGATAFFRDDGEALSILLWGIIALLLLFKELVVLLPQLGKLLAAAGASLWVRAKQTEEMRYCKCCGGLAVYLVTTCVPHPKASGPIPDRRSIFVCREHHPNPDIGAKAEDLHAYIRGNIHPAATEECVFPHNPY